jgi:hypothetical protein
MGFSVAPLLVHSKVPEGLVRHSPSGPNERREAALVRRLHPASRDGSDCGEVRDLVGLPHDSACE